LPQLFRFSQYTLKQRFNFGNSNIAESFGRRSFRSAIINLRLIGNLIRSVSFARHQERR